MDLLFGIIFLVPAIWSISIALKESFGFYMLLFSWPIYLAMGSIVKFVQAFTKIEIYEKGILTKDNLWEWEFAESYRLKEGKNTATFDNVETSGYSHHFIGDKCCQEEGLWSVTQSRRDWEGYAQGAIRIIDCSKYGMDITEILGWMQ